MSTEDNSDIESSSDEDKHNLAMLPPIEKENAKTDMDSGASDDMNDGLLYHLSRRLLNSTCDSSLLDKGNKLRFVERTQRLNKKSRKAAARNWKKDTDLQPTLKLSEASAIPEEWKEIIKSPIDAFRAMFSDELVWHVTNQTNLYAVHHGKGNLNIFEDEIRTFIAVLLMSGYSKVPYRNLYWANAPDIHNEAVSCAMSRNRFREILNNLHLADNTQITEDRYYKVRVLFEKLNFNLKQYGSFVSHSVDESITPYYGKKRHKTIY